MYIYALYIRIYIIHGADGRPARLSTAALLPAAARTKQIERYVFYVSLSIYIYTFIYIYIYIYIYIHI